MVRVIHSTSGDFVCKHCRETWNEQDEDIEDVATQECSDRVCEDPECECDLSTDHGTHELEPAPMSWFEEATIKVDQAQEEVAVSFEVSGKRFRIGVHYAANVGENGSLVLSLPGTSGTREVDGRIVVAD